MKIYIQYEGKFFGFDGGMWDKLKYYNVDTFKFDSPFTIDFKPQFNPGDRIRFEDLGYWTEVVKSDCRGCALSDIDCVSKAFSFTCASKGISFREFEEMPESEKAPNPQPTTLLDNERNRMAWEMFKSVRAIADYADAFCLDMVFKSTDAFIARAKQEAPK
jgi:hypothetical protein